MPMASVMASLAAAMSKRYDAMRQPKTGASCGPTDSRGVRSAAKERWGAMAALTAAITAMGSSLSTAAYSVSTSRRSRRPSCVSVGMLLMSAPARSSVRMVSLHPRYRSLVCSDVSGS